MDRFSHLFCFFSRHDRYDAYLCKLGGTEKSHRKAPVLVIQTFVTFFKVPLEANEAKEEETTGIMSDPSKRK